MMIRCDAYGNSPAFQALSKFVRGGFAAKSSPLAHRSVAEESGAIGEQRSKHTVFVVMDTEMRIMSDQFQSGLLPHATKRSCLCRWSGPYRSRYRFRGGARAVPGGSDTFTR